MARWLMFAPGCGRTLTVVIRSIATTEANMFDNTNTTISQDDLQALEALSEMFEDEQDAGVGQAQFC